VTNARAVALGTVHEKTGVGPVRIRLYLNHDLAAAAYVGGDLRAGSPSADDLARFDEAAQALVDDDSITSLYVDYAPAY
jgi:hypothetical protein